jgi:predicted RNase H-like HicB family nuclease
VTKNAISYHVIVHPAGLLDSDNAGYWTEVIALPACLSEGRTTEEAIARTREAIVHWLRYTASGGSKEFATPEPSLDVNYAM